MIIPHIITKLLQSLEGEIKHSICDKIKKQKILPPLYRNASGPESLFASPHVASHVKGGDASLQDIPFQKNHLPVVWYTDSSFSDVGKPGSKLCEGLGQIFYYSGDPVYLDFVAALRYSNWLLIATAIVVLLRKVIKIDVGAREAFTIVFVFD